MGTFLTRLDMSENIDSKGSVWVYTAVIHHARMEILARGNGDDKMQSCKLVRSLKTCWLCWLAALVVLVCPGSGQVNTSVPGVAQIGLAGLATGTVQNGDSAPLNSPPQVNLTLVAGQGLSIAVSGAVGFNARTATTPPDGDTANAEDSYGNNAGIGAIIGPRGALAGIFLAGTINVSDTPPRVDYSGGARDIQVVTAALQEPFFIGSGKTSDGKLKTFVVPAGATRLFLGVIGYNVQSNTGWLDAVVSFVPVPPATNPLRVYGVSQIGLAGLATGTVENGDSAPLNSPPQVNLTLVAGQGLRIVASGAVGFNARTATTPPDGDTANAEDSYGNNAGIGAIIGPRGALTGIFVSNSVNASTPPRVDFSSIGAQDLPALSPPLQQPFYIGSGITSTGAVKKFVVPAGATRLFLGVIGYSTATDTGSFIVTVSPDTPATPLVQSSGVVNGAGFGPAPVAPGAIVSIFGTNLGTGTSGATSVPLPTTLAGTSVWFDLTPAPIYSVAPGQANVQVPFEINANSTQLVVVNGGLPGLPVTVNLSPNRPGIFTYGAGLPVIVDDSTGFLATNSNPVKSGDVLTIYAAGLGPVSPPVPSGTATPESPLSWVVGPVSVIIGGVSVTPLYAGLAPDLVGVYQVNVSVPASLSNGSTTLQISVVGSLSNAVPLSVGN